MKSILPASSQSKVENTDNSASAESFGTLKGSTKGPTKQNNISHLPFPIDPSVNARI
jgi:hypothetical protein